MTSPLWSTSVAQYRHREVKVGSVEINSIFWCSQVPPLQGKLQYMRVLNDLPPFGGILFQTVGLVMYIFRHRKFTARFKRN